MILPSAAALLLAGAASGFSPRSLWEAWPSRRFVPTPAPCLRHTELVERLRSLEARHAGRLALELLDCTARGGDAQGHPDLERHQVERLLAGVHDHHPFRGRRPQPTLDRRPDLDARVALAERRAQGQADHLVEAPRRSSTCPAFSRSR